MQQFKVIIKTEINPQPFIQDWYGGNIQYHVEGGIGNLTEFLIVSVNAIQTLSESEILKDIQDLFFNQKVNILDVKEI